MAQQDECAHVHSPPVFPLKAPWWEGAAHGKAKQLSTHSGGTAKETHTLLWRRPPVA